jgi:hypothetical protein
MIFRILKNSPVNFFNTLLCSTTRHDGASIKPCGCSPMAAQLAVLCSCKTEWLSAMCSPSNGREVLHDLLSNGFTRKLVSHVALEVKLIYLT